MDKKSTDVIRDWLKRLRQLDYVESFRSAEDKREFVYHPLVTKRHELFENSGISWENGNQLNLEAFLKKGYGSWLENIGGTVRWVVCKKNTEDTATLVEISEEEAKEITCK